MSRTSFERINFSLRPAKAVERKMISYGLRKLTVFDSLTAYRYIGFGSTFFTDFSLFHKELGIRDMISIEVEKGKEDRFNFNLPFDCIKLMMGSSNTVLPSLDWDKRCIAWLDYDSITSNDHLADISTFCTLAKSASVFLVSANCHAGSYGDTNEARYQKLIDDLGEERMPLDSEIKDFSNEALPSVIKQIYEDELISKLRESNGLKDDEDKLKYFPLFNFIYRDGVRMLTLGGIVLNKEDEVKLKLANFKELDFYKADNSFFNIKIPCITPKEIRFLNSQLPNGINTKGKLKNKKIERNLKPSIPEIDMKDYKNIYKYFPVYTETKFN